MNPVRSFGPALVESLTRDERPELARAPRAVIGD